MKRQRIVPYNPQAVFFTMPLALLAVGSELDPERYEVVVVDARLDQDARANIVACAKRLRSMSPDFLTPIFYFKPHPGSALVIGAVVRGFRALAWKPGSCGRYLLQRLARYRCHRDDYRWPVEMLFTRWLVPAQRMS